MSIKLMIGKLYTTDGIPIHVCDFPDVQTFDDTDIINDGVLATIKPFEMTCIWTCEPYSKKKWMRLAYGWAAKAPIRKRVLQRLWKKKGAMA